MTLSLRLPAKYRRTAIASAAVLLIIVIGLASYWRTSRPEAVPVSEISEKTSSVLSADQYQNEARAALRDYEALLAGEKDAAAIRQRRDHLFSLTVAASDRDLHLKLVMLADALEKPNALPDHKNELEEQVSAILISYPQLKE